MTYLTYTEYKEIGGLDEAAFNRNIDRACAMIDNRRAVIIRHWAYAIKKRSLRNLINKILSRRFSSEQEFNILVCYP